VDSAALVIMRRVSSVLIRIVRLPLPLTFRRISGELASLT
jgi:hypothetical protein